MGADDVECSGVRLRPHAGLSQAMLAERRDRATANAQALEQGARGTPYADELPTMPMATDSVTGLSSG
jgi:hypothetical protein